MNNDQQTTPSVYYSQKDDEIDLIDLCKGLWKEKIVIIATIVTAGLIAIGYLVIAKPTYAVSVELITPKENIIREMKPIIPTADSDIFLYTPDAPLKQQQELLDLVKRKNQNTNVNATADGQNISVKTAFSLFLSTLTSRTHIQNILSSQSEPLKKSLGIDASNDGAINQVNHSRTIEYANTTKKNNDLQPDSYFLTYEGYDRTALKQLILDDINIASASTKELIKDYYVGQLEETLSNSNRQQQAELNSLENRIEARKWFLRASNQSNIKQLQEELNIATTINDKQTEIQIAAKLQNLQQRDKDTFYDNDLLALQAQQQLVTNNAYLSQLTAEIERLNAYSNNVVFSNNIVVAPENSIKPKKILILAISLLLGGFLGFIIAIAKYSYEKSLINNQHISAS
jgi:chain length determinant protein (polysaccharide antigen chain regulator)